MRLLNLTTGELRPGRCRSTNLCDYCAKLAAVENTEMLWLDALEQGSPALWLLLTTRDPIWDAELYRVVFQRVTKACKRRWPAFEYASLLEFTTGYGRRSGGLRRPHFNVFVRGVAIDQADELVAIAGRVWCARIDAELHQQKVYTVAEDKGGMRGLTRYVGMHFQKESQAPPAGWRGQRFRSSRGYFVRPRMELREEARRSLKVKRAMHRGLDAETAELEVAAAELVAWELRHVNPSTVGELRPAERNR